jgi:predicted transcriptional regulator|tara:strand:- start:92 stop:448 length:357 start_codon:yes stop_codon:yes gene_type:complete
LNFGFSNPIRVNELFRPILQELSLEENISFEKLKNKVLQNINRVNQNEPVDIIGNNLNFQILDKIEESLNLLFMNNLIVKENNLYNLSEKTKLHIQSLDPIKINGFSGNVEFIMDFLP